MSNKLPNILWIQTDEQRPDSLGCYGSEWAKTPNIDRIALKGTVFKNAVCPSPVCLPSRSSQLCARYPHEFSCLNNMLWDSGNHTFPEGYITFPEILTASGYNAACFGRHHTLGTNTNENIYSVLSSTPDILPEYGSATNLSPQYDEKELHVIKRPGVHHFPLILAGTYPAAINCGNLSVDRALNWLSKNDDNPFMLTVSFNQPHTPVLTPEPFDTLYNPDDLPIRYFDNAALETRSEFDKAYQKLHLLDELSKNQVRQMWKDYMGLCAYVDYEVGRLIKGMENLNIDFNNTVVIYSCDHGKNLGEWGTGEKGSFDSQVWRVPFIWSWPGVIPQGERIDAPCETIDTGRTLLEIIGLSKYVPSHYRGRNLFSSKPNEKVFGVTRPPFLDIPDFDKHLMRIAIRTSQYRLDMNINLDGSLPDENKLDGNMFDLIHDPYERLNIFYKEKNLDDRSELIHHIIKFVSENKSDNRLIPQNAGVLF